MRLRLALCTFALVLTPAFAMAAGCSHDKQAMSCGEGSTYDPATGTCTVDATT